MWVLWLLDLCIVLSIAQASNISQPQQQHSPPLRFFIDEGYFLPGDTEILRAYIAASDNGLEISGESTGAFLSVKGYYVPEKWDVYWTMRQSCHKAYPHMKAGQMVNCIPGVEAISLKRRFVQTWQQAYGESAFTYIPPTYLIPEQYWLWRNALLDTGSPPDSKWVLKANVHRGKGVQVVSQTEALSNALAHKPGSSSNSNGVEYHNILIQKYCEPQMVIAGRSSYIRVWLLVTNITPLRAYLFKGGFAIFGKQKGKTAGAAAANSTAASSSSDDLIVNLWIQDREKSPIWSLSQLEMYLDQHPEVVLPLPHPSSSSSSGSSSISGSSSNSRRSSSSGSSSSSEFLTKNITSTATPQQRRTFADAWKDMEAAASIVLAAALPAMRAAAANSSAPDQGMFEYFGLDFVFDAYLKPWMLEVNALPSLARRKGSGCTGDRATENCQLTAAAVAAGSSNASAATTAEVATQSDDFDEQKEQFVHDMLALLGLPVDTPAAAAADAGSSSSSSDRKTSAGAKDALDMLQRAAAAAAATGVVQPVTASASNSSSSGVRRLLRSLLRHKSGRLQQQRQYRTSSSTSSSSSTSTCRRLLTEAPEKAAAAAAVTVTAELQSRQQQQMRLLLVEQQQRRQQHRSQKQHKQHHRPSAASVSAAVTAAAAAATAASTDIRGIHSEIPDISLHDVPAAIQDLLCTSSSSGIRTHNEFACTPCLTAADLAAVAAAEAELQRLGRFVPVYDLIDAHRSSKIASGPSGPDPKNQAAASSSSSSSSGDGPAAANGAEYLSSDRSVWQRLYNTWKGMSTEGVGLGDLGIMRYYTEESQLAAARKLELTRQDYVMSAWLRTRQQQQLPGGCLHGSGGSKGPSVDCVIHMLQQVVKKCHIN